MIYCITQNILLRFFATMILVNRHINVNQNTKDYYNMNSTTFCFIICINNNNYKDEVLFYINNLLIPPGYSIEIITVENATSIYKAYNQAMHSSHAKYKIYLHQDVFIINKSFLFDLLKYFEDENIGMLGLVGAPRLPKNGIMWQSERVGVLYCNEIYSSYQIDLPKPKKPYSEVKAVDGLLIATQHDLQWREDILDGWDFYDVSQSLEFINHNLKVVVPETSNPWAIHDSGFLNMAHYYDTRKLVIKEYPHFFVNTNNYEESEQYALEQEKAEKEWQFLKKPNLSKFYEQINKLIAYPNDVAINELVKLFDNVNFFNDYFFDTQIACSCIFTRICENESLAKVKPTILDQFQHIDEIVNVYTIIKFQVWRYEFGYENSLLKIFKNYAFSDIAIFELVCRCAFNLRNMIYSIANELNDNGDTISSHHLLEYHSSLE